MDNSVQLLHLEFQYWASVFSVTLIDFTSAFFWAVAKQVINNKQVMQLNFFISDCFEGYSQVLPRGGGVNNVRLSFPAQALS
jgi:hypothetical protein